MIENPTSCTASSNSFAAQARQEQGAGKSPISRPETRTVVMSSPVGLGEIEVAEAGNGQLAGHIDATAPTGEDQARGEPVDHAERGVRVGMGRRIGHPGPWDRR